MKLGTSEKILIIGAVLMAIMVLATSCTPSQQEQLKAALAYEGSKALIENAKIKSDAKAKLHKATVEIQEIIAYGKTPQVKHIILFLGKYNAVLNNTEYKQLLIDITKIISNHINLISLTRPLTPAEMLVFVNILRGIEEGSK